MGKKDKNSKEEEVLTRIAIVNPEKCKPSKCRQECKKSCPVVRMGKFCIEVTPKDKIAWISEELCIGCNDNAPLPKTISQKQTAIATASRAYVKQHGHKGLKKVKFSIWSKGAKGGKLNVTISPDQAKAAVLATQRAMSEGPVDDEHLAILLHIGEHRAPHLGADCVFGMCNIKV